MHSAMSPCLKCRSRLLTPVIDNSLLSVSGTGYEIKVKISVPIPLHYICEKIL